MSNIEAQRVAFEAWAGKLNPEYNLFWNVNEGRYHNAHAEAAWMAWKAACQACCSVPTYEAAAVSSIRHDISRCIRRIEEELGSDLCYTNARATLARASLQLGPPMPANAAGGYAADFRRVLDALQAGAKRPADELTASAMRDTALLQTRLLKDCFMQLERAIQEVRDELRQQGRNAREA